MANELTRSYFKTIAGVIGGEEGDALRRFAENPQDKAAADTLWKMPEHIGTTRTTCIPTLLDAGHAPNALPQKATANVKQVAGFYQGVDHIHDLAVALGGSQAAARVR